MTKTAPARQGVWLTRDPDVAAEFAELAAKKQGSAQIYPLLHRSKNPALIRLTGDETNLQIAATLADAWERGFDSVMLKNFSSPRGKRGVDIVVVRSPAQLRSPSAKFDPAKIRSRDLLASVAATGALPLSSSLDTKTKNSER